MGVWGGGGGRVKGEANRLSLSKREKILGSKFFSLLATRANCTPLTHVRKLCGLRGRNKQRIPLGKSLAKELGEERL